MKSDKLNINVNNDMTVKGARIESRIVNANIKGNLTVESKQDEIVTNEETSSFSISLSPISSILKETTETVAKNGFTSFVDGVKKSPLGLSPSVPVSDNYTKKTQIRNRAGFIGTEELNVNVGGTLTSLNADVDTKNKNVKAAKIVEKETNDAYEEDRSTIVFPGADVLALFDTISDAKVIMNAMVDEMKLKENSEKENPDEENKDKENPDEENKDKENPDEENDDNENPDKEFGIEMNEPMVKEVVEDLGNMKQEVTDKMEKIENDFEETKDQLNKRFMQILLSAKNRAIVNNAMIYNQEVDKQEKPVKVEDINKKDANYNDSNKIIKDEQKGKAQDVLFIQSEEALVEKDTTKYSTMDELLNDSKYSSKPNVTYQQIQNISKNEIKSLLERKSIHEELDALNINESNLRSILQQLTLNEIIELASIGDSIDQAIYQRAQEIETLTHSFFRCITDIKKKANKLAEEHPKVVKYARKTIDCISELLSWASKLKYAEYGASIGAAFGPAGVVLGCIGGIVLEVLVEKGMEWAEQKVVSAFKLVAVFTYTVNAIDKVVSDISTVCSGTSNVFKNTFAKNNKPSSGASKSRNEALNTEKTSVNIQ